MEYELGSTHKNKNKAALETPLKYISESVVLSAFPL